MGEDGFASLFGGLGAMLSKQVPYTMAKQVSFDFITASLYALFAVLFGAAPAAGAAKEAPVVFARLVPYLAAACASVLSCVASHPGDMALTRCYQSHSLGTVDAFRQIHAEHGMGGFLLGIKVRERGGSSELARLVPKGPRGLWVGGPGGWLAGPPVGRPASELAGGRAGGMVGWGGRVPACLRVRAPLRKGASERASG